MRRRPTLPHARSQYRLLGAMLAVAVAALATASIGSAGTSTVTVGFNAAGFVSLTNTCQDPSATQLGTVIAGSAALTDTGPGACQFAFSSNQTSMLRVAQPDGTGTAMSALDTDVNFTSTGSAFWDVSFASASVGWAVAYGEVWKTIDGGVNWTNEHSLPDGNNWAVHAVNTTTVVIGTTTGSIWRGINGGDDPGDFSERRADNGIDVEGMSGSGATVWAVGDEGTSARSTDSGATWTSYNGAGAGLNTTIDLFDVAVVGTTAYAVGGSCKIYKTTGTSWSETKDCGSAQLNAVDAFDANRVSAAGDGGFICSTSDGTNWPNGSTCGTKGPYLRITGVARTSATDVFAMGRGGWTYASGDSGATFTAAPGTLGTTPLGFDDPTPTTFVGGGYGSSAFRSTDSGATWTLTEVSGFTMTSVTMVGPGDAVAVGDEGLVVTTNDLGLSTTPRVSGTTETLRSVDFAGGLWVVAVGNNGTVIYSDDAGVTWTDGTTPTSEDLLSVDMVDELTGWAVGTNGTILITGDGGITWTAQTSGTTAHLVDIAAVDDSNAWVVSTLTTGRRTTNGGTTWNSFTHGGVAPFSIAAASAQEAWVPDSWNTLRHTTNGGGAWSNITGLGVNIYFVDHYDWGLLARSEYPQIRISTDDGVTWDGPNTTYGRIISDTAADDVNGVLIVGEGGFIGQTGAGTPIPDYGGGATWAAGPTQGLFGACLQDFAGANATADWTIDGAGTANQCEANDADPWNPIPTNWSKIGHTTLGGATGTATLVWGARPAENTPPGEYRASIIVEAAAPNI